MERRNGHSNNQQQIDMPCPTADQIRMPEPQQEKECRICLMSDEAFKIISPCNCTGSMKFVHEECLKRWLNSMVEKSRNEIFGSKAHIDCELCCGKIFFTLEKDRSCHTKKELCDKIKDKKTTFIALLLLLLINLAFFLAILGYIVQSRKFIEKSAVVLFPLMISGMVLFGLVVIICFVVIANKFIIKKNNKILSIVTDRTKKKTKR